MSKLDFYDREDRPWPNPRLTNAAIQGHTTAHGIRLWIRVYERGKYWLLISEKAIDTDGQPRVANGAAELVRTNSEVTALPGTLLSKAIDVTTDLTAVFDIGGLKANTPYHYAVFAEPAAGSTRKEMWEIGRDEPHWFQTAREGASEVRFGLFSCHMPYPDDRGIENMEMWSRFQEELDDAQADFIIAGVDQVYTDGNKYLSIWRWLKKVKDEVAALPRTERIDIMKSWFRDIYRGYWGDLSLRKVLRNYPTYMIWDDHEIMDGWGSYTRKELSNELDTLWELEDTGKNLALAQDMREAAGIVYGEYQHSHNPPTPAGQYDYAFEWGPAAFYVLDMRGTRDYNRKQDRILGEAQFARLEQWLAGLDLTRTKAVFVVSTVPVVHASSFIINFLDLTLLGLKDDMRDAWEHDSNQAERDKLLDAVFAFSNTSGCPLTFLSGDVHIGAAFRLAREGYPAARVHQITSSAITYAKSPGALLKLAVREKGELKPKNAKAARTTFNCLHVFSRNNFGILRVDAAATPVRIGWDLFGAADQPGEIVSLKRVWLE